MNQCIRIAPIKLKDDSDFFVNNWQLDDQLKSEVQTLHSEVKSLTGIIKVLNKELEVISASKAASKSCMGSVVKDVTCETSCSKCALLEMKLQEAVTEISSLKLIIDLLKNDSNSCTMPHQEKQNMDNILSNTDNSFSSVKKIPFNLRRYSVLRKPRIKSSMLFLHQTVLLLSLCILNINTLGQHLRLIQPKQQVTP